MKYTVQRFFIFTESKIIDKELERSGRVKFFPGPRQLLDAFLEKKLTKAAEEQMMTSFTEQYDVPFEKRPGTPKDELIFELPSYGTKVNDVIEFLDEIAEKYDKPFRIQPMLEWYVFKAITEEKFTSKFINIHDQVSLVDIRNIQSGNKNGISFIDNLEKYDYLKDNISKVIEQFKSSKLKTLDIYSLIMKPIEEPEGMEEKSFTKFEFKIDDRVMNLITYPSTDVSITIVEVV